MTRKIRPRQAGRPRTAVVLTALGGLLAAAVATASPQTSTHVADTSRAYSFQSISNPSDPTFDQLLGINSQGLIVGYYGSGASAKHPNKGFSLPDPYAQSGFVSENFPGSVQTQVVAVNSKGDTAGFWVDAKGDNHGFVDWNGVFTTVDDPLAGGKVTTTQLLGLNAAGVAVGFYNDAQGNAHAFRYNQNTRVFTALTPPNADSATAAAINAQDNIVGFLTRGKTTAGFLIAGGHYDEFDLPKSTNTQALGINDSDEVVGSYVDASGQTHGFTLTSPTTQATFAIVNDPLGTANTIINGINNKGQLVGFYVNVANKTVGFLATP